MPQQPPTQPESPRRRGLTPRLWFSPKTSFSLRNGHPTTNTPPRNSAAEQLQDLRFINEAFSANPMSNSTRIDTETPIMGHNRDILEPPSKASVNTIEEAESPFWIPAGLPRNRFAAKNFIESLGFAIEGMIFALKTQRNFRIDVLIAFGVIALGSVYHLRLWEWAPLVLVMGMVLFSEAMNTAIEFAVDMVTQGEFDMRAKIVKDVSAAACLLMAFTALGVGTLIFTPHLWMTAKQWFQIP